MKINIINTTDLPLPKYETEGSAGLDLMANIPEGECVVIFPKETKKIPTGIKIEIPDGYEGQLRGRSGLALDHGITVAQGVGTIDSDFRGEVCAILTNNSRSMFRIDRGDKIAQLVISPITRIVWNETESLSKTKRGNKGFGSTGISLTDYEKNQNEKNLKYIKEAISEYKTER